MRKITKAMFVNLFSFFLKKYWSLPNHYAEDHRCRRIVYERISNKFGSVVQRLNKGQDVSKEFWKLKQVVQKYLKYNN